MVVVQYAAKLSSQKLSTAIMRLKPTEGSGGGEGGGEGGREKVSRGRFNLQVAPEEVRMWRIFPVESFSLKILL